MSHECDGRLDCADLILVELLDREVRNRKSNKELLMGFLYKWEMPRGYIMVIVGSNDKNVNLSVLWIFS